MAAINLTISLDELREFVPKFVNATKKEVSLEMRRQGRLLVAGDSGFGLVSITAPQGDGDSAKAIGDLAVRRDISKVFAPTSTILGILRESAKCSPSAELLRPSSAKTASAATRRPLIATSVTASCKKLKTL